MAGRGKEFVKESMDICFVQSDNSREQQKTDVSEKINDECRASDSSMCEPIFKTICPGTAEKKMEMKRQRIAET